MHPNRNFAWTDRDAMLEFVAERSFATLCTVTDRGLACAHVPVLVADRDHLRFHLARGNSAARAAEGSRVILSLLGPDAYVSPDWYGSPDQVPTWNYVAVECEGPLRRLSEAELASLLDDLSRAHEERLAPKEPWTRAKMSEGRFEAMLKAIVGFEVRIEDIRGTRKLGQNKGAAERTGAIAGLSGAGSGAIAALMRGIEP